MPDIRKQEKCNGPVKGRITYCKSERPWRVMNGRVNGKVSCCQLWGLLFRRINPLFISPGSPIFKAVQKKRYKALYRALKESPTAPKSAVAAGSERSHIAPSVGAP